MEELIQKYIYCRNKANDYNKQMEELKQKIKILLKEESNNMKYEKNGYEAIVKTMHKSSILKKNVPSDIWEKYSIITPYEILSVKKK